MYKAKAVPAPPFPCASSLLKYFQSETIFTVSDFIIEQSTSTLLPQFTSAFPSKYSDANVALHDVMKIATTPAKICQAFLVDANPRCNDIKVMRSNTNRNGPANISPIVDNGPCSSMIMILWHIKATAEVVNNPNAKMLSRESRYDCI
jgi:hypothetical protein